MKNSDGDHEHLTDGTIAAYLDGELSASDRADIDEHRGRCAACDVRIGELRRATEAVEKASVEARRPPEELRQATFADPAARSRPGYLRAAAVIAAVLVGGAAAADAALPGHPLRSWLGNAIPIIVGDDAQRPADRTGWGGLSVKPDDGSVQVTVSGAAGGTTVVVTFVDGPRASVSARGGTFSSGPGVLEVSDPTPGEIQVRIPSLATSVRVSANGRRLLEKDADGLTLAPRARHTGERTYRFSLPEGQP